MRDSRRNARLMGLLKALAEIRELKPGIVTRGFRAALAKMMLPPEMADPDIQALLKRIGLSPKDQRQARERDPFEARFTDGREMVALEHLATLAEFTPPTPEETTRTLRGDFSGGARKVVAQALAQQAQQASRFAKKAAEARHASDNEKREEMRAIWAKGNFLTKNDCAEEECAALGMSQETARKALRGAADPKHWPAKLRHEKQDKT